MLIYEQATLVSLALHYVGCNVQEEEDIRLSKKELKISEEINNLLVNYFLPAFKSEEYFHLYHDTDLKLNEVYSYVSEIFDHPDQLFNQSVNLAKHLYAQSVHPKIKGGDFYTVYFKDCIVDGETVDAVGLFKSENKDVFLKVYPSESGFELDSEEGVNIKKLDKGCLIFNSEREKGYLVAVVDHTNKGVDARYWIDDFLKVKQREDEYFQTQNVMTMCKSFVTKELPQQFEVSKADQIDLLNKSVNFFKEKENFDMEEFTNEVISQPEVIEQFNNYKKEYQVDCDTAIADNFAISETAVKKQARVFKSIIKLDKNFHIYIHGDRNLIEQGEEDGRKFYKLFYEKEC